jgi:hypothetical protein
VAWRGINSSGYLQGLFVSRWNGSNWQAIGSEGLSSPNGIVDSSSICLDSDNNPVISRIIGDHLYVSQWDGVKWQDLDNSKTKLPNASASKLILDANNRPIVSIRHNLIPRTNINEAYVIRWDGSKWEFLGGNFQTVFAKPLQSVGLPFIFLNNKRELTVFWAGRSNDDQDDFYINRWNESTKIWELISGGLNGALSFPKSTPVSLNSVILDEDRYVISWSTSTDHFISRQTNPSSWDTLGGNIESIASADSSLVLAPSNNPVLLSNKSKLVNGSLEKVFSILRWDNSTWSAIPNFPSKAQAPLQLEFRRGPDDSMYFTSEESDASGTNITIYRENR